jgi:phenylacetate-coenzyme A ligase PaaK-like adenylate-forming protein
MQCQWKDKILGTGEEGFSGLALEIFRFQYENNPVYNAFVNALGVDPHSIGDIQSIPYLPIRFFKTHSIQTTAFETSLVFESSGTTGSVNSRHYVKDENLYIASFMNCFEHFYGSVGEWCIIGLLPSYLERQHSSLVFMVDHLIHESRHEASGFYLYEFESLHAMLNRLREKQQKTLLIGVSFALLDFAEAFKHEFAPGLFDHTIVMETGGMKGRRKEIVRQELHEILRSSFHTNAIHSEYGMTELLSQAYSGGGGIFECPPWMKIVIRDEEDPLTIPMQPRAGDKPLGGAINIIDLANVHSCSFIATEDAGRIYNDGRFEVLGRIDHSDIRGCSLMVV